MAIALSILGSLALLSRTVLKEVIQGKVVAVHAVRIFPSDVHRKLVKRVAHAKTLVSRETLDGGSGVIALKVLDTLPLLVVRGGCSALCCLCMCVYVCVCVCECGCDVG